MAWLVKLQITTTGIMKFTKLNVQTLARGNVWYFYFGKLLSYDLGTARNANNGQMQTLNFLKNMERLMQKWEYKIITVNSKKDFRTGLVSADAIEEELNIHGQQGWELSAAEGVTLHPGIFPVLIFKRAL